ncbi:MAG: D-tyrosyl-tRNA(Tyr) deacylase [Bacteriovoracaceae bacterium]|jgi:D-tyrosyl-tRNA(Tyr) deacylase
MKVLIQRIKEAQVKVEDKVIASVAHGYLLYVCFEEQDTMDTIDTSLHKILNLRIFEDLDGKMNKNISQVNGSVLSVSQFTLSWDGRKGHRPSFDKSMQPNKAKIFYRTFNDKLEAGGINVEKGKFGAEMEVYSINDGPVTFHLEF